MLHFLHNWLRKRPPTGYSQEKVRHFFHRVRAAMSKQQDGVFF
jgi:hypothetical protein